jgi:hypothetical protein
LFVFLIFQAGTLENGTEKSVEKKVEETPKDEEDSYDKKGKKMYKIF